MNAPRITRVLAGSFVALLGAAAPARAQTTLQDLDNADQQLAYGVFDDHSLNLPIDGKRPAAARGGQYLAFAGCTANSSGVCSAHPVLLRDSQYGNTYNISVTTSNALVDGLGPHVTTFRSTNLSTGVVTDEVFVSFYSASALTSDAISGLNQVYVRHLTLVNGALQSATTALVSRPGDFSTSDCVTSDAANAMDLYAGSSTDIAVTVGYSCYLQSNGSSHVFVKTLHYSGAGAPTELARTQADLDPATGSAPYASVNPSLIVHAQSGIWQRDVHVGFEAQASALAPRRVWLRRIDRDDYATGSVVNLCPQGVGGCLHPAVTQRGLGVYAAFTQNSSSDQVYLAAFSSGLVEQARVLVSAGITPALSWSGANVLVAYQSGLHVYVTQLPVASLLTTSTWTTWTASVSSSGTAGNAESVLPVLAPTGVAFLSYATNLAPDNNGSGYADLFLRVLPL